jgi:hypothetical protein
VGETNDAAARIAAPISLVHLPPRGGEAHATALALEQPRVEGPLRFTIVLAHGGLREMQHVSRAADALQASHGSEALEPVHVYRIDRVLPIAV